MTLPAIEDEALKGGRGSPTPRVSNPDDGLRLGWWCLWRGDRRDLRPRRPHVPLLPVLKSRSLGWRLAIALVTFGSGFGCPDPVGDKLQKGPEALTVPPGKARPASRGDSRFIKIRDLLRKGSDDPRRATELYSLVHPLCTDAAAREDFIDVARWSASFSDEENRRTAILALDTIEYVATVCFDASPDGTLALLDSVDAFLPREPRIFALRARLYAAEGRLEDALEAAKAAVAAGSVHALALTANIQARIARASVVGYRAEMLEAAIETVSATPDARWRAIDLAAILSTKARLLWERAAWEDRASALRTLKEADAIFERLSVPPFLVQTRTRALDNLCFDSAVTGVGSAPCRRAALEAQILGAAAIAGFPPDPERFDEPRRERIATALAHWNALPKEAVVVLIARGDEAELLEWTRPTARLLRGLWRPDLRLLVIDRARDARASALIDRIVKLAALRPTEVVTVGREPLAMPCLAAILANRMVPKACPLDAPTVKRLEGLKPYGTAVVVGRDLDAELDDLALYHLDATLLSFRLSRLKKPVHAWLKSVSDIFLLAPPEAP